MKSFFVLAVAAALVLPGTANAVPFDKAPPIKMKEEIKSKCGLMPLAPTIAMDAKTASLDDLKTARAAYDQFASESESYQVCLLSLQKTLIEKMSQADQDLVITVFNRVSEEKDVLGTDFNKLVDGYNAAHGIVPPAPKSAAKPAAKTNTTTPAAKPN
jgi:hypothetical protein